MKPAGRRKRHASPPEVPRPLSLPPDERKAVSRSLGGLKPGQGVVGVPSVVGAPSRAQRRALAQRKAAHKAAIQPSATRRRREGMVGQAARAIMALGGTYAVGSLAEYLGVNSRSLGTALSRDGARPDAWVARVADGPTRHGALWQVTAEGRRVAGQREPCHRKSPNPADRCELPAGHPGECRKGGLFWGALE